MIGIDRGSWWYRGEERGEEDEVEGGKEGDLNQIKEVREVVTFGC